MTSADALAKEHMLATKNGQIVVVGGPEEHQELKKEGWEFKVFAPKEGSPEHGGVAEDLQGDPESGPLGSDYDVNHRVYYHMIKGKLVPCFPMSEDDGYLLKALGVALDARGEGEPEQRERLKQLGDRVLRAKHQ